MVVAGLWRTVITARRVSSILHLPTPHGVDTTPIVGLLCQDKVLLVHDTVVDLVQTALEKLSTVLATSALSKWHHRPMFSLLIHHGTLLQ